MSRSSASRDAFRAPSKGWTNQYDVGAAAPVKTPGTLEGPATIEHRENVAPTPSLLGRYPAGDWRALETPKSSRGVGPVVCAAASGVGHVAVAFEDGTIELWDWRAAASGGAVPFFSKKSG